MNEEILGPYENARNDIICRVSNAVLHVGGVLDHFQEKMDGVPSSLSRFLGAMNERMQDRLYRVDEHPFDSLAYYDSQQSFFLRVVAAFSKQQAEITQWFNREPGHTLEDEQIFETCNTVIQTTFQDMAIFQTAYKQQVAAERNGSDYGRAQLILAKSLVELQVALGGSWEPEFVTIAGGYKGTPNQTVIETSSSRNLSTLSQDCSRGRLRVPGLHFLFMTPSSP